MVHGRFCGFQLSSFQAMIKLLRCVARFEIKVPRFSIEPLVVSIYHCVGTESVRCIECRYTSHIMYRMLCTDMKLVRCGMFQFIRVCQILLETISDVFVEALLFSELLRKKC